MSAIILHRDWEVRINATESYFINICGPVASCKDASVCKKGTELGSKPLNYGSSVVKSKQLPTLEFGSGFSITFNGTARSVPGIGCNKTFIRTKINFECDKILVSLSNKACYYFLFNFRLACLVRFDWLAKYARQTSLRSMQPN